MGDNLKDYQFIYHDDQNKTRENVKQLLDQGFEIFGTAVVMKRKNTKVDIDKKPRLFVINKPVKGENENGKS